jgi:hypothetical protein
MVTYASEEDLAALFETKPKPARIESRLGPLLQTATDELVEEARRDFFRHPTSGSRTWLLDGDGTTWLHAHEGIVSLELLEVSTDGGRTFTDLLAADYALAWGWKSGAEPPEGEPWFHVRIIPGGTATCFPRGTGTVRATGASGWASVPGPLREGTAQRARQLAYADPSYEGSVPADDAYGMPTVSGRWPDITYKFLKREARRFAACDT